MKALETSLFALTLIAVPALGWLIGRALGRRDWKIFPVLLISVWVALLPHICRLLALSAVDPRGLASVPDQIARANQSPEVGFFFLALSVFMTMLGWTSTPVSKT